MNVSTLTPAEIDILADHERSLEDTDCLFTRETIDREDNDETKFDVALRLKVTLDALEQGSMVETNERALALYISGEFWLWRIYMGSLGDNSFLAHWVEALHRLDTTGKQNLQANVEFSCVKPTTIRIVWIKTLLGQTDLQRWFRFTPAEVYNGLLKRRKDFLFTFDLQPFTRMLVERGIYDKPTDVEMATASFKQPAINGPNSNGKTASTLIVRTPEDTLQEHKAAIISKLAKQPHDAIFDITRLPITIPYLEFLTTLLTDHTLEKHNIETAPIVTQYIQHALRIVEAVEKPPSPSLEADPNGNGHQPEAEYGKDAQERYIQLLVLFIKNVIRKGLVESSVLYYEIAEITVRYVWIKEVREFRQWAENGIDRAGGRAG